MDAEKPIMGIALVLMVTEVIMQLTRDSFDKKRFAPPVAVLVGIILSVIDGFVYGAGLWYVVAWEAVIRGIGVGVGAIGAHSTWKNYKKKGV